MFDNLCSDQKTYEVVLNQYTPKTGMQSNNGLHPCSLSPIYTITANFPEQSISNLLRKCKAEMPGKPNYLSVPSALKELEKIELIRQPNGNYKLDHAVTATQKVILGAFGLDEEWVKAQARLIGKDIKNAAMLEEQKDDDEEY